MIFGPPLAQVREVAKRTVQAHFVGIAESDGTQPTLRAMYVLKLQEAKRVLADEPSLMIEQEAELRGLTPREMATVISNMAEQSRELEIARMKVNIQIEEAKNEAEVVEILESFGLALSMRVER
ncbi:hypothetical protein [Methylobacterium aquaticum]|uniref:Uncharacterized protein n=1 Tax=Methylobacterium aquaticum TaxID=270351 RepID=A0A0C6FPS4_9HYPH|nr:hypothetical protein [Methylobacterium aquaticum]BAQ50278.1 hypothetical protein Maq22A_3p50130 [Methylobacterium aquaticum]